MMKLMIYSVLKIILACAILVSVSNFLTSIVTLTPNHRYGATKISTKLILFWMPMYNSKTFGLGSTGSELFKHCEIKNCYATHNHKKVSLENFDAIVFHAPEYSAWNPRPKIRKPNQRYIFASMEAPVYNDDRLKQFGAFYNWTMTYRLDSDIPWRYGYVVKRSTNYTMPSMEFINNKTKVAAWVVSHCRTWSRREIVYQNLLEFLNIDVYGFCGNFTCSNDTATIRGSSAACYDFIVQNYKFYLSFENTYCTDYVTEKLYMMLERNIVPIVYGRFDYDRMLPPNSVIRADKFPSTKRLAEYILFLDKNPEEYLKYFEWKQNYIILRDSTTTACKLCKMLNDDLEPKKVYEDINTWWSGKHSEHCIFSWKDLPVIASSMFNDTKIVVPFMYSFNVRDDRKVLNVL